ncbi:hypothetical protein Gotri_019642, partial [Gossypium trilobum]|nr:hypothetical protein [Gossypium trilobum]
MSESWINLCTDGTVQIALGDSEAGEVKRNGKREWIMGYNRNIGKYSAFNAELWVVLDGLALIHKGRYDGVLIQTDSLEVVKAIQDSSPSSSNSTLIRRINIFDEMPREVLALSPMIQEMEKGSGLRDTTEMEVIRMAKARVERCTWLRRGGDISISAHL